MLGFEDIYMCSRRDYEEEEYQYLPNSGCFSSRYLALPSAGFGDIDGDSLESVWDHLRSQHAFGSPLAFPSTNFTTPEVPVGSEWDTTSLQARFSVLDDWATALHAHHVKGVVHGKLTQESVGVVDGRGTLRHPSPTQLPDYQVSWARETSDDDVYGARWAATELFHIDNDNPSPTRMSDVYSFGCLMLQMLTGEVPYCGTKRSEQVVYLKYLGREPIDNQTPKVADRYVAFMLWCWSPEPEKRPTMKTVVEFIREEIKRLGEQRG